MADVSLIAFIPANKKIEVSALYDNELLENSFLNEFNASDDLMLVINTSRGTIENTKRFR